MTLHRRRDVMRLSLTVLETAFPGGEQAYLYAHLESAKVQLVANLQRLFATQFFGRQEDFGDAMDRYFEDAQKRCIRWLQKRMRSTE